MTIASQTSRIAYTGDGTTTAFAVPFYFQANADLVVYLQDALGNQAIQVLGTNYNLTGATLSVGGTCTFTTAPTTGYLVTVYRDPAVTQTTSYNNNDPFAAKSHELALDKLTTIDQRLKDQVSRTIHQTEGEAAMVTMLAPAATRKNKLLGFGTNGELTYPLGPSFVGTTYVGVADVDSRATAQITSFAVGVNIIRTGGYTTPGDGGAGTYKRVGSMPTSGAFFQSADGAWWALTDAPGSTEFTVRAAAIAAFISVSTTFIRTAGYAAVGDGGDALYKRATSDPGNGDRFQSADGAWWVSSPSGLFGVRLAKTGVYTVTSADDGATIALNSAYFALTFPTASGLNATHRNVVVNEDATAAKTIVLTGGSTFKLYPLQTIIVFNQNNVWQRTHAGRWRLPVATTIYFDNTNGNDANDGLAAGAGRALKTAQAAYDLAATNFDLNGKMLTMLSASGQTYSSGISTLSGMVGSTGPAGVVLDFAGSTITTAGSAISTGGGVGCAATAFTFQNMVMNCGQTTIDNFGAVLMGGPGLNFGVCNAGSHIKAAHPGAQTFMLNNYTVSGNAGAFHLDAQTGGMVVTHGRTASAAGVTAFGSGFASAFGGALIYAGGMTFASMGLVTGQRYNVAMNGVIDVTGGGATYFPGNAAGASATGGQYA